MDWSSLLLLDVPPPEIVLRGTAMYLSIFVLLRVVFKREAGATGITDLLVVVLIADAAQNGLSGDYHSISSGLLLVGTIVFWAAALNFLAWKFSWVERLIRPHPLPLVKNGEVLRRNLAKELMTESELYSHLREQGATRLADVHLARMEPDGKLSVTLRD